FHVTGVQTCALPISRFEGDLDMRMDRDSEFSAYQLVNSYSESQLRQVLSEFGEIRNAAGMARVIVESRETDPIRTTSDLKEALQDRKSVVYGRGGRG